MYKCVMISMPEEMHNKFKEYCKENKIKLSTKLQDMIANELRASEALKEISVPSEEIPHTPDASHDAV